MKYKTFDRNMLKDLSKEFGEINPAPKTIENETVEMSILEKIQKKNDAVDKEKRMPTKLEMLEAFNRLLYAYDNSFVEYQVTTTKFGRKVEVGYYKSPNHFVRHNNFGPAFMHERNIGKDNYFCEIHYYLNDTVVSEEDVWLSSQTPDNFLKCHDFHIGMMQ